MDSGSPDPLVLIRALRRPGDEVQLTRAIEKLAQADQGFAQRLLGLLIDRAPNGGRAPRPGANSPVRCSAEQPMVVENGNTRRIDLVLESAELKLFIEVKLHSDYQPYQLRDYLRAIRPSHNEYLIAVTRNVSRYREPAPDAAGWLGVIRWANLAAALGDLPSSGPVRDHWQLLLKVLEEDGDLGSSSLPRELVTAYEQSDEAYARLTEFLEQIGGGILHRLRSELTGDDAANRSVASFASARRRSAGGKRSCRQAETDQDHPEVIGKDEGLYLAFNIPSNGPEVLWIGYYVDAGQAMFYIAAGWGGEQTPPAGWEANWRSSVEILQTQWKQRDLYVDNDGVYCQLDYKLADFIKASDVPAALAQRIDEDLPTFIESGMFKLPGARRQ